jgi:hypothetical protein
MQNADRQSGPAFLDRVKSRQDLHMQAQAQGRFNACVKCGGGAALRSAGKRCRAASRGKTCMHGRLPGR